MMRQLNIKLLQAAIVVLLGVSTGQLSNGQITNDIRVTMSHPFVVGNTTLPPGQYNFRMASNSDQSIMTVTSADGKTSAEFLVRQSDANHVPRHTELVFERFGTEEFLHRVYEKGDRLGVAVDEPSRLEVRLQKEGQHAIEHTEEQQ